MRFKDFIIRKCGGKTITESAENRQDGYKAGYNYAYAEIREYAKELNG